MPSVRSLNMPPSNSAPPLDAAMRSPLSRVDILEHRLVQAEVGDQLLQSRVLVTQLFQFPDLAGLQAAAFLLPPVEHLFRDVQFARDIRYRHPRLMLLHRGHDLLSRIPFLPHRQTLLLLVSLAGNSHSEWLRLLGEAHISSTSTSRSIAQCCLPLIFTNTSSVKNVSPLYQYIGF